MHRCSNIYFHIFRYLASADVNGRLNHTISPTELYHNQRMFKMGETPVARRERRTQELQKNRLSKALYH